MKDNGFQVCNDSVARRIKEDGLRFIVRRNYRATSNLNHTYPVADNLLKRRFTTTELRADSITDGFKAKIDDGLTLKITDALRAI